MAKPLRERNLWKNLWDLIKKSVTKDPTECLGTFKGQDHHGNKYYELEADPRGGRRYPTRWYESDVDIKYVKIPVEWQGWLRRTRDQPPEMEEIIRNMAAARMKQENAAKKEASRASAEMASEPCSGTGRPTGQGEFTQKTVGSPFPDYGNLYERTPGEHADVRGYRYPHAEKH